MQLAVYRLNKDGRINKVHEVRQVDDLDDLEQRVIQYNTNPDHKDTVEIVELAENSLELFLYNRSELYIKNYKEDIENMASTMCVLEKSLDWLCDRVKDAEQIKIT